MNIMRISTRYKAKLSAVLLGFVGLLLMLEASAQGLADLKELETMIKTGKAETAYQQMAPQQYEKAGNPDFDYLLGLAALQSGRPDEATLAFERVLAVRPDMLGARLDMARAYFELGNYDLARQEFEELQKLSPPAEAEKVMRQYLKSIKKTQSPKAWAAFVEATIGHNTNVNSAGASSVFIPALGGTVTLDASSVETADEFLQVRAAGQASHKINKTLSLYGSIDLRMLSYTDANSFNTRQGTVAGGIQKTRGKHTLKAGLGFNQLSLDGAAYRDIWSVSGEWAVALNKRNTVGAFVQRSEIRYTQETELSENSNLSLAGGTWTTAFGARNNTLFSASLFGGFDEEREGRLDGSRKIVGARMALQHQLNDHMALYGSAGIQKSNYKTENGLFLEERDDEQVDATLGLNWKYKGNWVINPYISYIDNNSNIDVNEYGSTEVGLTLRRTMD